MATTKATSGVIDGGLTVAQGGTGAGSHTANNVLVGAGTGAISSVAPSTSGNVLTSNGTVWASAAAATTDLASPGPIGGTTPSTVAATTVSSTTGANLVTTSGNVGIGTASALAKMDIDQSSTTAAVPVLRLDQADISEEMISFNTTVGTGNAIELLGTKVLTTTHFIKIELPGGLTRYIPVGTIAEAPI